MPLLWLPPIDVGTSKATKLLLMDERVVWGPSAGELALSHEAMQPGWKSRPDEDQVGMLCDGFSSCLRQ